MRLNMAIDYLADRYPNKDPWVAVCLLGMDFLVSSSTSSTQRHALSKVSRMRVGSSGTNPASGCKMRPIEAGSERYKCDLVLDASAGSKEENVVNHHCKPPAAITTTPTNQIAHLKQI